MTILTGDDRYFNNILTFNHNLKPYRGPSYDKVHTGLDAYNEHPLSTDYWYKGNSLMITQTINFQFILHQTYIITRLFL